MRHLTLFIAMLALAVAAPAIADKGGNGNGGSSGSDNGAGASIHSYSPGLSVTWPNGPTAAGTTTSTPYVVEGCGYDSSYGGVTVVVYSPYAVSFAGQMPEGGCISLSNFATQGPGDYRIEAWQHVKNRDVVVATTRFSA
jgi:hypothetical protein